MDEAVELDVEVSASDVKAFTAWLRQGPLRDLMRQYRLVGVVAGALLGVTGGVAGGWGFVAVLVALGLLCLSGRAVQHRALTLTALALSGHYRADARGLTFTRPGASSLIEWSAFAEIVTSEEHLLLRHTPLSGWLLPRRSFADPGDERRLLDLARAAREGQLSG